MKETAQGEAMAAKKRGRPAGKAGGPRKVVVEGAVPEKKKMDKPTRKVGRPKKVNVEYATQKDMNESINYFHSINSMISGDFFDLRKDTERKLNEYGSILVGIMCAQLITILWLIMLT